MNWAARAHRWSKMKAIEKEEGEVYERSREEVWKGQVTYLESKKKKRIKG